MKMERRNSLLGSIINHGTLLVDPSELQYILECNSLRYGLRDILWVIGCRSMMCVALFPHGLDVLPPSSLQVSHMSAHYPVIHQALFLEYA